MFSTEMLYLNFALADDIPFYIKVFKVLVVWNIAELGIKNGTTVMVIT